MAIKTKKNISTRKSGLDVLKEGRTAEPKRSGVGVGRDSITQAGKSGWSVEVRMGSRKKGERMLQRRENRPVSSQEMRPVQAMK